MKRPVLIALFFAFMLTLSATVSFAEPGCDKTGGGDPSKSMMEVLKNHGNAMRVRDRAYSRQIVKRNDPAMGVGCFDKALAVTSRLGTIFSDVKKVNPGIFMNTTVFTGIDMSGGIGGLLGTNKTLATNLNKVVIPVLGDYLNDFTGTLSEILGVNSVSGMLAGLVGDINGFLASFDAAIGTIMATVGTLQDALDLINDISDLLDLPIPALEITSVIYPALMAAQSAINTAISSIMSVITTAISSLMTQITSLFSDATKVNLTCDNIQKLWDDGDDTSGAASIEGNGAQAGMPYFSFDELVGGAPAGVVEDMLAEINVPGNQAMLTKAKNDLTNLLNTPNGNFPLWKQPVVFNADTTVADIISEW